MMPLDICIESYGAAVHVVDSLLGSGLCLRPTRPRVGAGEVERTSFDEAVRTAATELPFVDAQAVWLVDVCGCSYDAAAAESRTDRDITAARLARGRRYIRNQVALESTADHIG